MRDFIAAVQHYSYGTVVDYLHAHVSTETPASNFQTGTSCFFDEDVENLFSCPGQRGTHKAGAPPMAGVRHQSELADQQNLPFYFFKGQVEFSGGIRENPQLYQLGNKVIYIAFGISGSNPHKHAKPGPDAAHFLTFYGDGSARYSLKQYPQSFNALRAGQRVRAMQLNR